MIRAIRITPMCLDDPGGMISGWNVAPAAAWTLTLAPSASACAVMLWNADMSVLIATGAAVVGTDKPVILMPQSGQSITMQDDDLGWHMLLTTTGTESARTIRLDPVVDLPDEVHPLYQNETLALARATAAIDAATHYLDEISITCPMGLGAGLGALASANVDGVTLSGQVESITWTGTPDGYGDSVTMHRYVPMIPAAPVAPPALPTVADDAGTTDAATETSGNVLDNDDEGLTVVAVEGLSGNVGVVVAGSNGGEFTIAADGAWTFDPAGDFGSLTGTDTAETSITYHASDGVSEAMGTLTVTVSSSFSLDPYWGNVVLLLQPPADAVDGSTIITDYKGHPLTIYGDTKIDTDNGINSVYFDGIGDWISLGESSDWALGSGPWTIDFAFTPISDHSGGAKFCAGLMYGRGYTSTYKPTYEIFISSSLGWVVFMWNSASEYIWPSAQSVPLGVPCVVSVVKDASTVYLFLNGSLIGSKTTNFTFPANSNGLRLNYCQDGDGTNYGTFYQNNHTHSLRITKGVARYITAHTPLFPYPVS